MIKIDKLHDLYLKHLDKLNAEKRYVGNEHWFHASRAGNCYKKSLFDVMSLEQEPVDIQTQRKFDIGNRIHGSIQDAIEWVINKKKMIKGAKAFIEHEFKIPELNVRGFCDVFIIGSPMGKNGKKVTEIIDIKTMASYPWKMKFGRNPKIDDNAFANLQLGTYQYALKQLRERNEVLVHEPSGEYVKIDDSILAFLYFYKKDDSSIKKIASEAYYVDRAISYWEEVNSFVNACAEKEANGKFKIVAPELCKVGMYGVPFVKWECNYCPYTQYCVKNLSSGEKKTKKK